jgi:hypothetical protein
MTNDNQRLCAAFALLWEKLPENMGQRYIITGRDRRAAKELLAGGQQVHTSEIVVRFRSYAKNLWWHKKRLPAYGMFENLSEFAEENRVPAQSKDIACSACGKTHNMDSPCDVTDIALPVGGSFNTLAGLTAALATGFTAKAKGGPLRSYFCPKCGTQHSPHYDCTQAPKAGHQRAGEGV